MKPPPQAIGPASIPSEEAVGVPAVRPVDRVIKVPSIQATAIVIPPTIWSTYSFAPEWFADARHEARTGTDHHARRREIVFAVCCAESYLVEWVRDEVLRSEFRRINEFFPPNPRHPEGVRDK